MSARFQIRRWPACCPPLVGEVAIVDTAHGDRIVKTYRDEACTDCGGALQAATDDLERWNATPPMLVPVFCPRTIGTRRLLDGKTEFYQMPDRANDQIFYDETNLRSLYRDFAYVGLE